jgi:hypothetical protein
MVHFGPATRAGVKGEFAAVETFMTRGDGSY